MSTVKIYHKNPYIKEFQANITKIDQKPGKDVHIKLNQTAFYPEGGGQPCDLGFIGEFQVKKVFEENGDIFHVIEGIPKQFENLQCGIDWKRRFDFMQQHLGQHILSASLEKLFEAETVGFHLTEDNLTIDIDKQLDSSDLDRIEYFANQIIYGNLYVKTHCPSNQSELASFPLRKDVAGYSNPRIVEIDQFDYSPCGGTHPKRTGEVGIIKILNCSTHREGLRIEFVCGNRALKDYAEKTSVLSSLKSELSCSEKDLPTRCAGMKNDLKEITSKSKRTSERLLDYQIDEIYGKSRIHNGHLLVSHVFETDNLKDANVLTSKILKRDPSAILMLACPGIDFTTVLLASSPSENPLDLNLVLKDLLDKYNGRGGGKAHHAQGIIGSEVPPDQLLHVLQSKITLELEKSKNK